MHTHSVTLFLLLLLPSLLPPPATSVQGHGADGGVRRGVCGLRAPFACP